VVGVPDATWGGRRGLRGVEGSIATSEEELAAFLATRLAKYKIPRRWVFIDACPHSVWQVVKESCGIA